MTSLRERRRRIGLKGELLLTLMPTATVLAVLALVEALSSQRLLFASLASSAFLIYLDPANAANSVRTLVAAQMAAALVGLGTFLAFGPGYLSGGAAMVATIERTAKKPSWPNIGPWLAICQASHSSVL